MKTARTNSHSRHTRTALEVLGRMIAVARKERKMSQAELAKRIGVTRPTVMAIEKGSPRVAVGSVFEAAVTVGIPILAESPGELDRLATSIAAIARVVPERARRKQHRVDDDF